MIRSAIALSALGMALFSIAASARDIVLTNDDGLTSNVVAVYKALKAAGHDVVVSVPCTNQSGMSGAVRFSRPIAPLTADCLNGAAEAGAPGAGAITREGLGTDFFYVDGTPVMAMLYGVDVVAAKRWGHAPDLVLSGPNEGQNLGGLTVTSGTVGAAQAASLRGIPAIALSAGGGTAGTAERPLDNPKSLPVAREVARLVATLGGGENKPMLPAGLALNVNFPDRLEGARWRVTQVGTRTGLTWRFAQSMAREQSPKMKQIAAARGMTVPDLPGIVLSDNEAAPTAEQANDEAVVNARDITVSPLQAGYGITGSNAWLNKALAPLSGR